MNERRLLVVYTGGTFGMRDLGSGLEATDDLGAEIASLVAGYDAQRRTRSRWAFVKSECVIDSAEATQQTMVDWAAEIRMKLQSADCEETYTGVLVIHGTDTLAYTAARMAFELADLRVPIVFTGSQLPLHLPGSDAPSNFEFALDVLSGTITGGTWVAFDHQLHPAVRVSKYSSESRSGFASPRALAPVVDSSLAHAVADRFTEAEVSAIRKVGVLSVFPGMASEQVRAALACYPDGLILECYGAGTAPVSTPGILDDLGAAIDGGTTVVAVTQCQTGSVDLSRYAVGSALARVGVLSGGDMTVEAALGKLGYLAGKYLDASTMRSALASNFIGEMHSPAVSAGPSL
ncbi:asparaginase [Microbacterium sp. LTA6]|uniref:asparaginase n=1 Tax=unclassified Microbacterium TaxID=2609290 RepID=UPI003139E507